MQVQAKAFVRYNYIRSGSGRSFRLQDFRRGVLGWLREGPSTSRDIRDSADANGVTERSWLLVSSSGVSAVCVQPLRASEG